MVGKILAWRRGGFMEYATTVAGVGLYTVFLPWFGLLMIWLFAFILGLFPIGKFVDPVLWRRAPVDANFVFHRMILTAFVASLLVMAWLAISRRFNPSQRTPARLLGVGVVLISVVGYWLSTGIGQYAFNILHHLVLPILTLTLVNFAGTMLLTRNSMLETLREDYIMAARAKGLPDRTIRDKHAARNALLPVVTAFVLAVAFVLDGGVITETIFSWPGMGLTLLQAAVVQDIPMVIGALVFTGILALTAHLIADVMYAFLDPRIRYS
jgi:peptide/nickel transport system permease protein